MELYFLAKRFCRTFYLQYHYISSHADGESTYYASKLQRMYEFPFTLKTISLRIIVVWVISSYAVHTDGRKGEDEGEGEVEV